MSRRPLVLFAAGEDAFALPVEDVRGVVAGDSLRQADDVPDFLTGVVEQQGVVAPVVDLRLRFGGAPREDATGRILLVTLDDHVLGLLVDDVSGVLEAEESSLRPPPEYLRPLIARAVVAVVPRGERLLLLLDLQRVLSERERGILFGGGTPE